MKKRVLSILLAAIMIVSLLPVTAWAKGSAYYDVSVSKLPSLTSETDTCTLTLAGTATKQGATGVSSSVELTFTIGENPCVSGRTYEYARPGTEPENMPDYIITGVTAVVDGVEVGSDGSKYDKVSGAEVTPTVTDNVLTAVNASLDLSLKKREDGGETSSYIYNINWVRPTEIRTFAELQNLFTAGGSGCLAADITFPADATSITIPAGKNITIDLNGKVLNADGKFGVIKVEEGGKLTVIDSIPTTEHYFTVGDNGLWTLTDTKTQDTKTVKGGVITGGNDMNFGGVNVGKNATFDMNGGSIVGNTATGEGNAAGGGVYCQPGSSFTMTNSSICGNVAASGAGGVNGQGVARNSISFNFTMTNSSVYGNTCPDGDGGVYLTDNANFTMINSSIADNVGGDSGGVYVSESSFTMTGSSITGNRGDTFGGVYVEDGSLTMINSRITDNTAGMFGGGVFLYGASTVFGGTTVIKDNLVGETASNLVLYGSNTVMLGTGTDTGAGQNGGPVPADGMSVGVTLLDKNSRKSTVGAFTTNGTADDAKYFTPDSADYFVNFNNDHLELKEVLGVSTWKALQDAITAAPGSGEVPATATTTIKLTDDLTAPEQDGTSITIPAGKDITLDLNGKVLNAGGGNFSVIKVEEGGKLTLIDSAPTTEHYFTVGDDGLWTLTGTKTETTKTVKGGVITGGVATTGNSINGGGVYVNRATFTMNGGNIVGNTSQSGGGVNVSGAGAQFVMSGDSKIMGNKATSSSGGVYVTASAKFTMNGGTISSNTALGGGGVVVFDNGTAFVMSGGSIEENTATNAAFGGGVHFQSGTVTLGGTAKITGNTTGTNGTTNNLYLPNNKTVTLGTGTGEGGNGVAAPTSDFSVGVTTKTAPTAQAPVQITTNGTADDAKYFTPDSDDYFVNFNTDHLELKKTAYIKDGVLYVDGMVRSGSLDAIPDKETVTKIEVRTVSGAEANAFAGFGSDDFPVALTLPDGWQGDLPNEDGDWYGAKVNMTAVPTAVKNVTFQQRWPWNGMVDIAFTVTGTEGEKNVTVTVKNGSTVLASISKSVTIPDDGVCTGKCDWDANAAKLAENFHSENVTVEVAIVEPAAGQLWAGGPIWADSNLGTSAYYTFAEADTAAVGTGWRLPTKEEFDKLKADCTYIWENNGYTFTGTGGYSSQSISLPAAGYEMGGDTFSVGSQGCYWSSTQNEQYAKFLNFENGQISVTNSYATNKYSVRPVKDATPADITTVASATSAKGTIDLRTEIALESGKTQVSGVTWSDTVWGKESATDVSIGWEKIDDTPHTTGKIAEELTGNDIRSVILPKKDGDYKLTHSTGDLTSFVTFTVTGYPSYAITDGTAQTENGSITLQENAVVGSDVVVTVAPSKGYALKTLTYTVEGGQPKNIEYDTIAEVYQFVMPAGNVTVTAEFEVNVPIFDLLISDTEITEDNFASYVKGTTKVGDYTFAGWFSKPKGETEFSDTYDKARIGIYYYAKWTNEAGKFVLTDGIEIKADGVYIGGSETKATDTELEEYGIKFTAPAGDAPAILELDGATIAPTMEQPSRETKDWNDYSAIYSETCPLKINVKSESSVLVNSFVPKSDRDIVIAGIQANNNPLTISGEKLNVTVDGCNKAMYIYGIYVRGESGYIDGKVFTEVKNTCSGDKANAVAIMASNHLYFYGSAEVTAVVTRTMDGATTRYADGISALNGNINIGGDAVVNAYGGIGADEYYGVWVNGNILVCDNAVLNAYGGTKSGSDPVVKEALFLVNAEKTITVSGNGKIVADSTVKNKGNYGSTGEYYTVTGAQTDITRPDKKNTELTKSGDANIEIFAKEYTVSFNANGGTPAPSAQSTMAYVTKPDSMTKDGYVFAGWYKDAAFTQAWNFDTNYARQDITLYAKWAKQEAVATIVRGAVDDEYDIPVNETNVYLKRGDVTCYTAMTGSDGTFSFSNVPAGIYQLVVTKGDYTTTSLVNVFSGVSENYVGFVTLHMTTETSSKVEITGNDTPDVMVDGLEHVADMRQSAGSTVSVTLEVEKLAENAVKHDDKAKIEDEADSTQTLDYIDMTLLLKVNGVSQDNITDTGEGKLLEVVIPYDLSGKTNIALYRQHGDDPSAFKLPEGEANAVDGEYVIIDKANNLIRAYLRYFSTYAIGYEEEQSHSGGGGSASYAVELPAEVENGKIEIRPKRAVTGQTVTVTVTPDKGFTLDTLTVLDKNGKEIELKDLGNGKYSFKMPSGKVSISATFAEVELPDTDEYPQDETCPQDATCVYAKFTDADVTAWYHDGVHFCVENGYMQGVSDTEFAPTGTTTRAMIVTMLWRMEGEPVVDYAMSFKDAKAGQWYTEAIRWAQSNKIVEGYSAEAFGPDDPITREQMAMILYRYAKYHEIDVANTNTLAGFTDVDKVSSWALDAMKWANAVGLVQGRTTTTLVPEVSITRAEAATMVQRYCEAFKK